MKRADFYSIQVKYTGAFTDYSVNELYEMARAKQEMTDCFDFSKMIPEAEAKEIDGVVTVDNTYPCNKIATVKWVYIAEEGAEE